MRSGESNGVQYGIDDGFLGDACRTLQVDVALSGGVLGVGDGLSQCRAVRFGAMLRIVLMV